MLVCKDKAKGWHKVKSEVGEDEWGTYLRAAVGDFCLFTCGRRLHPSDPARLEDCEEKDMIEVENATAVELYLVLVPVVFDSDRLFSVTYTGNIGVGGAGAMLEARRSFGSTSEVKCHLLPAGFTPDDVSVAAGGKFYFYPPPNSTQGKLLIATILEDSQEGVPVKVVVLHGKFITPSGRRRVILPIFLQSKSQISAMLGPDDTPVNMVMIMAGLGSKPSSDTVASPPSQDTHPVSSGRIVTNEAPLSPARQSRGGTTATCQIS